MTAIAMQRSSQHQPPQIDWQRVVHTVLVSRALDELEETRLVPAARFCTSSLRAVTTYRRSCSGRC